MPKGKPDFIPSFNKKDFTSLVNAIVENTPKDSQKELLNILETWLREKESSAYLKQVASQIKTKILLGQKVDLLTNSSVDKKIIHAILNGETLPELANNRKYCIIIFNPKGSDDENVAIAVETFQAISKDESFFPVLFRIGQRMPIAIGNQAISPDQLHNTQMYDLPPIIGPVMDNLRPQQFAFGIVFGLDEFYDKDDWLENWKTVFWFNYPPDQTPIVGWPPQLDEKSMPEHKRRAMQILKFTSDRVKG